MTPEYEYFLVLNTTYEIIKIKVNERMYRTLKGGGTVFLEGHYRSVLDEYEY